MTYKSSASETLKNIRIQAAARQARWREKHKESGIVEKSFTIAEADTETFKKLADASRNGDPLHFALAPNNQAQGGQK